jgi:hypothetical protein
MHSPHTTHKTAYSGDPNIRRLPVSAPIHDVAHGREPLPVANVDHDLVPVVDQRLRGRPSETVCGTGDEDARHEIPPPSAASAGRPVGADGNSSSTAIHLQSCPGCQADHAGLLEAARRFRHVTPE